VGWWQLFGASGRGQEALVVLLQSQLGTGARGWLGAMCGESVALELPDSDLFWSKGEVRRGLGWWRVMRPTRSRSAAIGVQEALLEVGLGFWLSGALGGCMGPVASFYLTCFRSRQGRY
jgi:hypothetical protein